MINFKVHFELFLDGSHSNVDKHHICWLEEIKTSLAFTKLQTQKTAIQAVLISPQTKRIVCLAIPSL
ncbi:hypothetical protein Y011_18680 [Vibrio parahaemolyticus VP49]|nr:hypothetical protein Y011_18680 [Vibrio parahaemolyticus VP49]